MKSKESPAPLPVTERRPVPSGDGFTPCMISSRSPKMKKRALGDPQASLRPGGDVCVGTGAGRSRRTFRARDAELPVIHGYSLRARKGAPRCFKPYLSAPLFSWGACLEYF